MTAYAFAPAVIFSIGHSNHPIGRFLALLAQHGIGRVADIRSMPASRHYPQFGKSRLAASLAEAGIGYDFLGKALGGRPRDPACYEGGTLSYERVAAAPWFREGLDRLEALARRAPVAMMCAERDPAACHRGFLVTPPLLARGLTVRHILADGSLATAGEATKETPDQLPLFGA